MKQNSKERGLKFKKQAISKLTKKKQDNVKGGNEEPVVTTSRGPCTGFLCCHPTNYECITNVACPGPTTYPVTMP